MRGLYVCYYEGCTKSYNTKYNLIRHINTTHLKIMNYFCPYCPRKFPQKQNLGYHKQAHFRTQGFSLFSQGAEEPAPSTGRERMRGNKTPKISHERRLNQLFEKIPVAPALIEETYSSEVE